MRTNGFGDRYCHTADEVRSVVESRPEDNPWLVYATMHEPPQLDEKWSCEVLQNSDGELVCYIETDSKEDLDAIVTELKLEVQ